jgi:hypothetical protein
LRITWLSQGIADDFAAVNTRVNPVTQARFTFGIADREIGLVYGTVGN